MRIDLLGPVAVRREDGTAVTPSAPKRRALLSALAVRFDQLVATDELIELVWDGTAPPTARAALQGHVAALRRVLDDDTLTLGTRGTGYVLTGDPERVDALRFQQLCDRAGLQLPGHTGHSGHTDPAGPGAHPDDPALPLLRTALALWRGDALTDCGSALLRERTAPHLADLRLRALDRLADGLCRAGRGGELVAELTEAAAAHPSRQTLAARLIVCLDQAGRYDEASARYDRAVSALPGAPGPERRRAGARLGRRPAADAGPVSPAGRPGPPAPAGPPPAWPPPADRRFVGRTAELDRLDAAVSARPAGRPVLVTGPAGVGKTGLVQYWAQRSAERFPDGRLHVDLRGFAEDGPRDPAEVLGALLTALGVPEDELPDALDDRARRYRELLAGRRLLLVLDDACSYEQLAPLLPDPPAESGSPAELDPSAESGSPADRPGPVTVVTSRSRLRRLLAREGGTPLALDVLTPAEAGDLLARTLGEARVAAEPQAAVDLAERCDRLPLALRLAAARLSARPGWTLGDLAAELSDDESGHAALAGTGGPLGITAALDLTYRTLPPAAARLFTLLGLHPGRVVGIGTAAALADLPPAAARTLLARLDAVHLLEETTPGRYARRGLVRRYGARLAADLGCDERLAALDRLIGHYLTATASDAPGSTPAAASGPAGARNAEDWFHREEGAVRAVVLCAEEHGRTAEAWRLAHRAGRLYERTDFDRTHWRTTVEAGLRAARACADPAAVARLSTDLAVLLVDRRVFRGAAEQLERAVTAADRAGDPGLRHRCRVRVADALVRAGRYEQAVPLLTALVADARTPGSCHLLAGALTGLADALVLAGAPGPALAHADEALQAATARPGGADVVLATQTRARALDALGRPGLALASAQLAVALGRTVGDAALEHRSHALLADLLQTVGRTAEAAAVRRQAEALLAGDH
ncbi:BTAD domain-containing putative transcriptional regulator [Kitasatospora sp. NPDC056181]|uniref:AfsR/SARP family transcriptional regulator n=1 Tax=Kitasatospora sp. NPDC056181 TaxID=3345737 RepID=UPI0035E173A0